MHSYTGKLTVHNVTTDLYANKNYLLAYKFDITFNNKQLFLNNSLLKQLLSIKSINNFIVDEIYTSILTNKEDIIHKNKVGIPLNYNNKISIKIYGKYFYIYISNSKVFEIDKVKSLLKKEISNYIDE